MKIVLTVDILGNILIEGQPFIGTANDSDDYKACNIPIDVPLEVSDEEMDDSTCIIKFQCGYLNDYNLTGKDDEDYDAFYLSFRRTELENLFGKVPDKIYWRTFKTS